VGIHLGLFLLELGLDGLQCRVNDGQFLLGCQQTGILFLFQGCLASVNLVSA
jgi:hypothetical protein